MYVYIYIYMYTHIQYQYIYIYIYIDLSYRSIPYHIISHHDDVWYARFSSPRTTTPSPRRPLWREDTKGGLWRMGVLANLRESCNLKRSCVCFSMLTDGRGNLRFTIPPLPIPPFVVSPRPPSRPAWRPTTWRRRWTPPRTP